MTQNISPNQAYEWLKNGEAILIDVREPAEFESGHIAYASSVPLAELESMLAGFPLPPERKVIFQCLKGGRGAQACAVLGSRALPNPVFNIENGIQGWQAAGLPVIGGAPAGLSVIRQVQIIVGALLMLMVFLGFAGLTLGFMIAGILGGALFFAGMTGWCGLAMLLQRMPWNKGRGKRLC